MRWSLAMLALLAACGGSRRAAASITIELTAETRVDAAVAVKVTAANRGDEPAHEVQPTVRIHGDSQSPDGVAALAPGANHTWELAFPRPPQPGFFPVEVRVAYKDANAYPLSALLVQIARTEGAAAGPAAIRLQSAEVAAHGAVRIVATNPGPRALSGHVTLVLPSEFQGPGKTQALAIAAQDQAAASIPVENLGALPGSAYPAYVVFAYEHGGQQQAAVGSATITVVQAPPRASARRPALLILAGALLGLVGVLLWRRHGGT